MLKDLIKKSRTIRRFDEFFEIRKENLLNFIDAVRYAPSARNQQVLMFRTVTGAHEKRQLFPLLKWAGYLTDWDGPAEGERPAAYIAIGFDNEKIKYNDNWKFVDLGVAIQTINLMANDEGLAVCTIAAFNKAKVAEVLGLPQSIDLQVVMAIGKPAETVKITPATDDIKYYRKDDVHYVPKRSLKDIIL